MELSVRVSRRLQAKKDSLNIQASEPESFLNVLVPEPVSLKNVTQNNVSGLTPSAIRYRRHREKLQADPEKFAAYKEKDRKRSVAYRQNITPEKRERARLLSNLRTQKCRQKKKELGLPLNEKKVKPETRAAVLERREKERLRKAAYRAKLSPHEKAWMNRKRKERKQQANSPLNVISAEVGESLGTGFQTPVAKRMAVSRALMKLPRSPKKYAAVVEGLTQIRSPRRSKALQDIGFLRLPERRKLIFLNNINESIKTYLHSTSKKRSQMSNARRQVLCTNWQQQQFADLKQDLPCDWLLLVSDFGQNFTCHHQDEIQGAHWARTEVTIHPVEDTNVSIERHYFGSRHGKGPCDAEIGVVKKNATLAIKRRVAIISDAKGLFLWAKEYMTKAEPTSKRTFFLVEQGEINRDRPDRSNEKIRSLQGSRSVHAVRGITPYNIAYRKRSCFCFPCRNSDGSQCLHDEICGSWKVFKLQKQNVVQSQSNLEASLDVSPICSNSKEL
ncbi:hypothetical protein Bpfe_030491 [Biomphalaria pfeifferi]|uniref:Uncharacterized protein n=1 Tax=Biomphalaria pfeifferi TaxID=112525 RepID=A0AAD8APN8_BIOPF|nr:hypothetical protein Bpfe_030491 [Biomphalaria pfeifferi]